MSTYLLIMHPTGMVTRYTIRMLLHSTAQTHNIQTEFAKTRIDGEAITAEEDCTSDYRGLRIVVLIWTKLENLNRCPAFSVTIVTRLLTLQPKNSNSIHWRNSSHSFCTPNRMAPGSTNGYRRNKSVGHTAVPPRPSSRQPKNGWTHTYTLDTSSFVVKN
jgi:hypothetical protein